MPNKTEYRLVPETVVALRRQRGMTQQEVAEAGGISQQEVSLVEHGTYDGSTKRVAEGLAVALGVKIRHLCEPPPIGEENIAFRD